MCGFGKCRGGGVWGCVGGGCIRVCGVGGVSRIAGVCVQGVWTGGRGLNGVGGDVAGGEEWSYLSRDS